MHIKRVPIDPSARAFVYKRSGGICELCGEYEAVHVHHLTYERAGHEWPEDLRHVCIWCHCNAHPHKFVEMAIWELERTGRLAGLTDKSEVETEEEWDRMEEDENEQRQRLLVEKRERERELNEPALNLGLYYSSGYDIEAVEREERLR